MKKKLLGRRKQSKSAFNHQQDQKDAIINGLEDSQALSSSALERLQLHMHLQSLQNPSFSFYNNPALWPKSHPFQENKMEYQSFQSFNHALPASPQSNPLTLIQQDYGKISNNPHIDGSMEKTLNSFVNPMDSIMVSNVNDDGDDHQQLQQQEVSAFQAELDNILNNNKAAAVNFMAQQQGDQVIAAHDFDYCFKEMNVTKDNSLMWWSNDFVDSSKSASSNSWDSNSVIGSDGIFQHYDLGYNL